MEDLIKAFNDFRTNDNDTLKQGEAYIVDQIDHNPDFYLILFDYYLAEKNTELRKLVLICLGNIIKRNYKTHDVLANLQNYCNFLQSSLNDTNDTNNLKFLAHIICLLAEKINGEWDSISDFLSLIDNDPKYASFCIYLATEITQNEQLLKQYTNFLYIKLPDIITSGLKSSNEEAISYIPFLFNMILSKPSNTELSDEYKEILERILEIARKSLQMNSTNFIFFWKSLSYFNSKFTEPFLQLALDFFNFDNLSVCSNSILFLNIIINSRYLDPNNIADYITNYIQLQLLQDGVDEYNQICKVSNAFARLAEDQTYEVYENCINELLRSEDILDQKVGINILEGFFFTFSNRMPIIIGEIIDLLLNLSTNYMENAIKENIESILNLFLRVLDYFAFNLNDSLKINDFLIEILKEGELIEFHLIVYEICKKIPKSPEIFERWFELFQLDQENDPLPIPFDSFPVYYSILFNSYTKDVNISHDKYKGLMNYLIETFKELSEKVEQLREEREEREGQDDDDDEDEGDELMSHLYCNSLLLSSVTTLLLLFYFYDPLDLKDYVLLLLESMIEVILDEEVSDYNDYTHFDHSHVINNFTSIFARFKDVAINLLVEHDLIDRMKELTLIDDLFYMLIERDLFTKDDMFSNGYFGYVLDELNLFKDIKKDDLRIKLEDSVLVVVDPFSKFIYKINEDYEAEGQKIVAQQFHVSFINLSKFVLGKSYCIYGNINRITRSFLRVIKPKRVKYNSECKWYTECICAATVRFAQQIVKVFLSKIEPHNYSKCFDALKNLMELFMIASDASGHALFGDFVLPFFEKNQEIASSEVLSLFHEMILNDYAREDEIQEMINVMNQVIENNNETQYYDSYPALFVLMNDFITIDAENISTFCEYAIEKFNDETVSKSAKESCSLFLLSLFNANNENEFNLFANCLELFPFAQKKLMQPFFEQIKLRVRRFQLSHDETEALLRALGRYLGFQDFAPSIFGLTDDQHNEVVDMFKDAITSYCGEAPDTTPQGIIENAIAEQSASIQYVSHLLEN